MHVFLCSVLPICMRCMCSIICPRSSNISSYRWRTTVQASPRHLPSMGSFHLFPEAATSFFSLPANASMAREKGLVAVWHTELCRSCWLCGEGWTSHLLQLGTRSRFLYQRDEEKNSFPSTETGAFSAQLHMLKASLEGRRLLLFGLCFLLRHGCLLLEQSHRTGWKQAACQIWLQGCPLDSTNIQTCWLILEVNLHIWSSWVARMCEWLSFPP